MKKVIIHTDGGCHGNPGPGGWAAVLTYGPRSQILAGGALATTNNQMELRAAIEALRALKEPCQIELFTDSVYLRSGITSWLAGWKANGWRTKGRQPVRNEELWRELESVASMHTIEWKWLKGHAGHAGNEQCDQLAQAEIARIKQAHTREELQDALDAFRARDADRSQPNLF